MSRGEKIFVLPHMGLGDTIITCGMIRRFARDASHVVFVCKERYRTATTQLFSDLANVGVLCVHDDPDVSPPSGSDGAIIRRYARRGYRIILIGLHSPSKTPHHPVFANRFYMQVGLDPSVSHTDFAVPRNRDAEEALYRRVVRRYGKSYVVVHQDASRNLRIDRALLPDNVPVYDVHDPSVGSANVFDYCLVLERARAFHFIDSCFGLLADRLPGVTCPMTCHAYARDVGTLPGLYRKPVVLWYRDATGGGYACKLS